jgi:hypothetical protein
MPKELPAADREIITRANECGYFPTPGQAKGINLAMGLRGRQHMSQTAITQLMYVAITEYMEDPTTATDLLVAVTRAGTYAKSAAAPIAAATAT